MVHWLIIYDRSTQQINQFMSNSHNPVPISNFKTFDPDIEDFVKLEDPTFMISRDHKLLFDSDGLPFDSEPSVHPVQPDVDDTTPREIFLKDELGKKRKIKIKGGKVVIE